MQHFWKNRNPVAKPNTNPLIVQPTGWLIQKTKGVLPAEPNPEMYDAEVQDPVRRLAAEKDFIKLLLKKQREVEAVEKGSSAEETIAAMRAIANNTQPPEIFD